MAKTDPADLPVAPGEIIAGRYVVAGVLGSGGMGVVLAGRHLELGERVAIKFLHKEHAAHSDRFFREARAAARIRSEHVVRIFDVGRLTTGEPFIVMEHLEGEDLADRLRRRGPLPIQAVADVLVDVCHALAEAHAAGIVHRDLKPANVFCAKSPGGDDLVKLLDFGVAKVPEAGAITRTASVLGSPVYMSPEQLVASKDVDARADIWSLGVVLFELLTNTLPFEGDSLVHLAIVVREKATPSARAVKDDLPEALDAIIARCLSKDRDGRFPDVAAFAEALRPFVSPDVAPSIAKLRRILDEKSRQAKPELASTIPPSSDESIRTSNEALPRTARVPSGEVLESSRALELAVSDESIGISATLAAVSTSASRGATTGPTSAAAKARRWKIAGGLGLAGVLTVAAIFAGTRTMPREAVATTPPPRTEERLPVATATEPIAPEASPSAIPPAAVVTTTSPIGSARPAPKKEPVRAVRAPAVASVSPVAAPLAAPAKTVSCNPPYTIDETGLRRPKPECL